MIEKAFDAQCELEQIQSQLDAYSVELYQEANYFTVDTLIEAHRSTRKVNQHLVGEYCDQRERGYADGYAQGLEIATTQDYISVERLRGMTLQELVDLIGEK